jgi:hypothetical protein
VADRAGGAKLTDAMCGAGTVHLEGRDRYLFKWLLVIVMQVLWNHKVSEFAVRVCCYL